MILTVKILLTLNLIAIFYQDIRDRAVYWFLFLTLAIQITYLHYQEVGFQNLIINTSFNLIFTGFILFFLLLFIYFKTGKFSYKDAIGLGDILMFIAISCTFATYSFAVLFVFGLIASLICHLIITRVARVTLSRKRNSKHIATMVPLAGYLAIYYLLVYIVYWLGYNANLYLL
ncbi:type IV leader peptidase family protein [Dokdonia sp. Hel_I_53]|nr:type IV leader peptidase family protein [Dokdonia sp. Hel_I_53]